MKFPDACPNCLESPADVPIKITHERLGMASTVKKITIEWLMCARCAIWSTRIPRWRKRFVMIPAGLMVAAAIGLIFAPKTMIAQPMAIQIGLLAGAFVLAVFGSMVISAIHWLTARPDGCISHSAAVKPVEVRVRASGGQSLVVEFLSRQYAIQFVEANEPGNVQAH